MTPPTLHDALHDLARDVPVPSVVDSAISTAVTRRRRRFVAVPAMLVAAALASLAVPSVLGGADVPPGPMSGAGPTVSYDPNLETPWSTVDGLPDRLDEPLTFAYAVGGGGEQRLVSSSGTQYGLPDGMSWVTPAIADGGWRLAWYDGSAQELVLQDLRSGTKHRIPATFSNDAGTVGIAPEFQLHWSPDGALLGMTTFEPSVAMIDFDTAQVVASVDERAQVVGWRDDDTMIVLAQAPEGGFTDLREVDVDASSRAIGEIAWPDDIQNSYPAPVAISPDGKTLATVLVRTGLDATVYSWDLDTGATTSKPCAECSTDLNVDWGPRWVSNSELLVRMATSDGTGRYGAVEVASGQARTLLAVSPRLGDIPLTVGTGVALVASDDLLHGRFWWGWYTDRIAFGTGLALLTVILALLLLRRRSRRVAVR